ncbi:MAG: hypothetical protein AB1446_09885 [Bacillota bacterium]
MKVWLRDSGEYHALPLRDVEAVVVAGAGFRAGVPVSPERGLANKPLDRRVLEALARLLEE